MTKKRDVATQPEVIAINDRLKQEITKLEGGLCYYHTAGVDDASIAIALAVSPSSVRSVRNAMFGKLRNPRSPENEATPIDPRVDELVRVAANLIACVNGLTDNFNRLLKQLTVNQISNCRHLEIKPRDVNAA